MATTPPPARRSRRHGSAGTEATPVVSKGKLKIGKYVIGDTLGEAEGMRMADI